MSLPSGVLFIVATPLGNLGDITFRAVEILNAVDCIAAEDTRHSRKLLSHYGIKTPLFALHEHNESEQSQYVLAQIRAGKRVALISDAGTPLISDPGFLLVRAVRDAGGQILPIPGPSALIAALSIAGLPTDRFVFEGFLPAKSAARRSRLEALAQEPRTLVFYEAPHRVVATLAAMMTVFGASREAVLARELTKTFETMRALPLEAMWRWVNEDPQQQQGEIVLLIHGASVNVDAMQHCEVLPDQLLEKSLGYLSLKDAVALTASVTGLAKNDLYQRALEITAPSRKV